MAMIFISNFSKLILFVPFKIIQLSETFVHIFHIFLDIYLKKLK